MPPRSARFAERVTGRTILYSFLASVVVLPSLLIIWTRYTGFGAAEERAAPAD